MMPLIDWVVPQNLQAYAALYVVETGLREYLIEKLSSDHKQWKRLLPGDVLKKFLEARQYERSIEWSRLGDIIKSCGLAG